MRQETFRLWHYEASETLPQLPSTDGGILAYGTYHGLPAGFCQLDSATLARPDEALAKINAATSDGIAAHRSLRDKLTVAGSKGGVTRAAECIGERKALLSNCPEITVAIPTRDRPERLRRCLESIAEVEYDRNRLKVIVVDNASIGPETRQVVSAFSGNLDIRYLRETQSGSASARNRALPEVTSGLVAFTDDDATVDRYWLVEIARTFRNYPHVSCVTGLLLPRLLETKAQIWFEEWGGFSRGFAPKEYTREMPNPPSPLYPYSAGVFGTGNNMAFRTEDLIGVGGFASELGNGTPALGGVDSEILLRTVLKGKVLYYQPSALVWHEHRRSYEALRRQLFSYGTGLTAYLLKTIVDEPSRAASIATRAPGGVRFALSRKSSKNVRRSAEFPAALARWELLGMLYGPIAYMRSRWAYRKRSRSWSEPSLDGVAK